MHKEEGRKKKGRKEGRRKAAKTPTVVSSQISLEAEKHTLLSCTARTGSSESRPRTKL